MAAKRETGTVEAPVVIVGVIGEAGLQGDYLVLGVDLPGQTRTMLVVPADQASVFYPGREIIVEVRPR